jgi:hypothetical protein
VETIISLPRTTFSRTAAKTCVLIATKIPLVAEPNRQPTRLVTCETLEQMESLDADQLAKAVVAVSKIDRLTESAEEPLPSGPAPLVRLVTNDVRDRFFPAL